jgi:hypothetical protein
MGKTRKNCSDANNRPNVAALLHEMEALLSANPQSAPQVILKLLCEIEGKVELHVHFIVNSIIGNNVSGGSIIGNTKPFLPSMPLQPR